jgi:hypothetical protein
MFLNVYLRLSQRLLDLHHLTAIFILLYEKLEIKDTTAQSWMNGIEMNIKW